MILVSNSSAVVTISEVSNKDSFIIIQNLIKNEYSKNTNIDGITTYIVKFARCHSYNTCSYMVWIRQYINVIISTDNLESKQKLINIKTLVSLLP